MITFNAMKHNFLDIELAFEYVSSDSPPMNSALLSRKTGRIFHVSEMGDGDEDVPEDAFESDEYIEIPHKQDLGLGTELVRRFVRDRAPEHREEVSEIFSRKGAYARFKSFLEGKGLLEEWYAYENSATEAALREWCKENEIELAAKD